MSIRYVQSERYTVIIVVSTQDTLYRAALAIGAPNEMLRECAMRQQPSPALLRGVTAAADRLKAATDSGRLSKPRLGVHETGHPASMTPTVQTPHANFNTNPLVLNRVDDITVKAAAEAAERHLREERERQERAQAERARIERQRIEQQRHELEVSARVRAEMGQAADSAIKTALKAKSHAMMLATVAAASSDDVRLTFYHDSKTENYRSQAIAAASLVLTALQMRGTREPWLCFVCSFAMGEHSGGRKRQRNDVEVVVQQDVVQRNVARGRGSRGPRGSRGSRSSRGAATSRGTDRATKRNKTASASYAPMKVNELVTLLKLDIVDRIAPRPPVETVRRPLAYLHMLLTAA